MVFRGKVVLHQKWTYRKLYIDIYIYIFILTGFFQPAAMYPSEHIFTMHRCETGQEFATLPSSLVVTGQNVLGSKVAILGMVILPSIGNPYTGYINRLMTIP